MFYDGWDRFVLWIDLEIYSVLIVLCAQSPSLLDEDGSENRKPVLILKAVRAAMACAWCAFGTSRPIFCAAE